MIVRATKNQFFLDNPDLDNVKIEKGKLYIVYAIEKSGKDQETYFVIGVDSDAPFSLDPLPYPASSFTIVADRVSSSWVNPSGSATDYIESFEEWFAPAPDGLHTRTQDWGLTDEDHMIIQRYKDQYEKIYNDIIKP